MKSTHKRHTVCESNEKGKPYGFPFFYQGVGMNTSKNSIFEIWNTRLTFIIPVLTGIAFLGGSFWADLYFEQFRINFFKSSGFTGAFQFLFSNMKFVVLSIIAATIYYLLVALITFYLIKLLDKFKVWIYRKLEKDIEEDRQLKNFEKYIAFLFIAVPVIVTMYYFLNKVSEHVAQGVRFEIRAKTYDAVTISYTDPLPTQLKCAYPLGSIGNYNAYISESFEAYLIKESAITSIRYPLSTFRTTSNMTRKNAIEENWSKLCS
jgi:hypothetical protein